MTRQQRRAEARAKAKKEKAKFVMTGVELENLKFNLLKEIAPQTLEMMLGFSLMVLRDKHDFGKKRLERFADEVMSLYESFEKDYITLADLHQIIKEETGYSIVDPHDGSNRFTIAKE